MNNIELLTKWKKEITELPKNNNFFIEDGIVNLTEYNKQDKKILFLLLEPYNINKDINFTSLIPYLKNGAHGRSVTWQNGSKITAKLLNSDITWEDVRSNNLEKNKLGHNFLDFKINQLNKIAMVNIKKDANLNIRADQELIKCHAKCFSKLLAKQIENINPDIIYCGGTDYSDIFLTALSDYLPEGSIWEETDNKNFKEINVKNIRIINSYHPTRTGKIKSIFHLL